MKKYLMIIALAGCLVATESKGQYWAGVGMAVPTGEYKYSANTGYGVNIWYEEPLFKNLSWTGSVGFISFQGTQKDNITYNRTTMFPVSVGLRYYAHSTRNGLYAGTLFGVQLTKENYDIDYPTGGPYNYNFYSKRFAVGLEFGYRKERWDFNTSFSLFEFSHRYTGIRIGYALFR